MVLDFPHGQYQVGDHDRFFYERTMVTLVNFSQLESSFYELNDGHSSFDKEEARLT